RHLLLELVELQVAGFLGEGGVARGALGRLLGPRVVGGVVAAGAGLLGAGAGGVAVAGFAALARGGAVRRRRAGLGFGGGRLRAGAVLARGLDGALLVLLRVTPALRLGRFHPPLQGLPGSLADLRVVCLFADFGELLGGLLAGLRVGAAEGLIE